MRRIPDRFPRFALERLKFEQEKLEHERSVSATKTSFFEKHFAVLISATISLATIVVSTTQIYVAGIQKANDLQIAQERYASEEKIAGEERERQWNLEVAKFMTENNQTIFGGSNEQKLRMRTIISTTFPPEVTDVIFAELEKTLSDVDQGIWKAGELKRITEQIDSLKDEFDVFIWLSKEGHASFFIKFLLPDVIKSPKLHVKIHLSAQIEGDESLRKFPISKALSFTVPPELQTKKKIRFSLGDELSTALLHEAETHNIVEFKYVDFNLILIDSDTGRVYRTDPIRTDASNIDASFLRATL